jgi:ABC-type oligopeptide transport system substrate-binding subunit
VSRMRRIALLGLALLLVVTALAAAGCGPSKADVAAQQKQECFANERQLKTAIDLVDADTGFYPTIADVVSQLHVACPAGGTYSFDPSTDTVSCSVHGHP